MPAFQHISVGMQVFFLQAFFYSAFFFWSGLRGSNSLPPPWQGGALPDELKPQIWCLRSELNQRHGDFQSPALPTELQRQTIVQNNAYTIAHTLF